MTTKLPSRRETRRAHRPVPETPIPRPSPFRRRSGTTPTLHGDFPVIPGTPRTAPIAEWRARFLSQRSASLTEESVMSGAKSAHRIDVKSISSSDSTLSPPSAKTPSTASPPLHRAPSPPPPILPPRVPLRPARNVARPRPHLPAKQRSMSEAQRPLPAAPSTDVPLPRRAARSTSETVESRSSTSEALDATGVTDNTGGLDTTGVLDSTRDSNDSVFNSSSSSNDDKQVSQLVTRFHSTYILLNASATAVESLSGP